MPDEPPSNVVNAAEWKTEQFFRQLGCRPFVACVIGADGQVIVYEKSVTPDDLRKIVSVIEEILD